MKNVMRELEGFENNKKQHELMCSNWRRLATDTERK